MNDFFLTLTSDSVAIFTKVLPDNGSRPKNIFATTMGYVAYTTNSRLSRSLFENIFYLRSDYIKVMVSA